MPETIPVTAENFIRAESGLYMRRVVEGLDGFSKFEHKREVAPIDNQTIIRENRDTLYSAAVLDLDAGPVTITLPDAGKRFMSLQVIDEDEYTQPAIYDPGPHTITKADIGTRYVLVGVRTLVNPADPKDVAEAHALQDALRIEQASPGRFETPSWDPVSQDKVREALIVLASTVPDTSGAFGARGEVDPIRRLIAAAATWGGNPLKDAMYINVTPPKNDGETAYRLTLKGEVPVDGFWSVIVYGADGYIPQNELGVYSFNNITAKPDADGGVTIQFGGCDGKAANCLPIVTGWSYTVRLYRPRAEILSGGWTFPQAVELA